MAALEKDFAALFLMKAHLPLCKPDQESDGSMGLQRISSDAT